jgi:hypothetical protein
MAIVKLKRCSSPGIDHILAVVIQLGGGTAKFEMNKFNNFVLNEEELP